MANNNALSLVVNFNPKETQIIAPNRRTRVMSYFCVPLTTPVAGEFYQRVTDKADLSIYTADPRIESAFDEGLNEVYLLFEGFDDASIDYVSERTYSLVVSPEADSVSADFSRYNGYRYYVEDNPLILEGGTIANILALESLTGVFYADKTEDLQVRAVARLINEGLNPKWNNLQLARFQDNSVILKNVAEAEKARDLQLSFIYADGLQIVIPQLFYFRAGGYTVADGYIVEDIQNDIQAGIASYISTAQPRYINEALGVIATIGNTVIQRYIQNRMLNNSRINQYLVPDRTQQTLTDIQNGRVNNTELILDLASAVWWIVGTVTSLISQSGVTQSFSNAERAKFAKALQSEYSLIIKKARASTLKLSSKILDIPNVDENLINIAKMLPKLDKLQINVPKWLVESCNQVFNTNTKQDLKKVTSNSKKEDK